MLIATIYNLAGPDTVVLLPGVALFAFWVWMLVDCAKNERGTTEKGIWLLVIGLVPLAIGAFIYLFTRKLRRGNEICS